MVHRTPHSQESTITDWLVKNYPEVKNVGDDPQNRPGIVHRLDKDTSGILVIARSQPAFEYLKNLFQKHQMKKIYLALVWGKVADKSGIIDKPIGIAQGTIKRTTRLEKAKMVKEAVTHYRVKKYIGPYTLVEAEPKTGRTHQIRAHFAAIGHPIVGDKIYGKNRPIPPGLTRQFLHAESIEFTLPDGGQLKVSADLPAELDLKQFEREYSDPSNN